MLLSVPQVAASLDAISAELGHAEDELEKSVLYNNEWADPRWYLEAACSELLILAEALQLPFLRAEVAQLLVESKQNIGDYEVDPNGDPYLKWAVPLRRYVHSLRAIFATEPSRTITKDLESILRSAVYSITDPKVFGGPPQNEAEVHGRIEAVLRCVFPDLKHKPSISKPIKNFEPDTGLPSIRTLLEYKFVGSSQSAGSIADEILADTRGYTSREWTSFVYVIYETHRFRQEIEWRQLLRACGVDASTTVVVLSGVPRADNHGPDQDA